MPLRVLLRRPLLAALAGLTVVALMVLGLAVLVVSVLGTRIASCDQMLRSLQDVVLPLDDETVVLPGHGPATTIGRERATNPYLAQAAGAPKGRGL